MMKKIYNITALTAVLLFCLTQGNSQTALFLNINPDAQVMGMANTGTAMYANAFSFWNNSANTVFSPQKLDIAASYGKWQPEVSGNNIMALAGYGKISKNIALTAGFKYFTHTGYDISDETGTLKGAFTPKEYSAGIGLAIKILPVLSASVNATYLSSDIGGPKKGGAFAADIGVLLRLKCLNVGLTASNLGSRIDYGGTTTYSLPANLKLGVGTSQTYAGKHKISANLQGEMLLKESAFSAGIGAEYMYNNLIAVRGGYHYGDKQKTIPGYGSAGAGIRLAGIHLDASYLFAGSDSPLRNTFFISLGWGF